MPHSHSLWLTEDIHIPASLGSLDALHATIERFWNACDQALAPPPSGAWRSAFDTAVVEVGTNIMRHACADLPGAEMRLRLRLRPGAVVACFSDTGRAYQASAPIAFASPIHDVMALPEGGMGLAIAHTALDRFRYRRTNLVNIWRLVKTFTATQPRHMAPVRAHQ